MQKNFQSWQEKKLNKFLQLITDAQNDLEGFLPQVVYIIYVNSYLLSPLSVP